MTQIRPLWWLLTMLVGSAAGVELGLKLVDAIR
jgi:hypothetical protein